MPASDLTVVSADSSPACAPQLSAALLLYLACGALLVRTMPLRHHTDVIIQIGTWKYRHNCIQQERSMICCIIEWNGLLDMNVVDVANVSLSFLLLSLIHI